MENSKSRLYNIMMIFLGGCIMGFGLVFFIVPAQISAGGVSGIATVLYYLFDMPVGIMVFVLNIPIFILGFISYDLKFLFTSIIGTAALSLSSQVFETLLSEFLPISSDLLLCAVFGGTIYGFGLGLAFKSGGTTGGTDILSLVLKKHFPNMSVGQLIIAIDGVIITLSGILFDSLESILYSAVLLFVTSYVVDTILAGIDFAKTVYIISEKNNEIAEAIAEELSRGSTMLLGYSVYSQKNKNVLMCVMRKLQLPRLKKLVLEIDSDAFVIVSDAKEVIGRGFKLTGTKNN